MRDDLARALAAAFLASDWSAEGLVDGGRRVLGRDPRWLTRLAAQTLELHPRPPRDSPRALAAQLAHLPAAGRVGARTRPLLLPATETRMLSNRWRLPELHDLDDLARLLDLSASELDWYADTKRWARTADASRLQHYRVSHRVSASGAIRVLEAPKPRLRALQRRLLDEVVGLVPPHDAAHGFRSGGSVRSYAAPHAGRGVVLRLDLEAFFASVTVRRVFGVCRSVGYPEAVAHCLAGLMTSVLPLASWRAVPRPGDPGLLDAHWRLGRRLASPHLPQGAPTSPALANLAAFGLDVRLTALAEAWGGRYTRYADDLALSSARGWGRRTSALVEAVTEVVRDEGFSVHPRKTAVMPRRDRQRLGGLVVNDVPRVSRAEVDRLRAILHNCRRHGPASQNRDDHPAFADHLRGRIAWVGHHDPVRGARLLATYDAIDWQR